MRPIRMKYTVYDNRTDFPVIVDGTARECAAVMNMKYTSFRRIACGRAKYGRRWAILKTEDE